MLEVLVHRRPVVGDAVSHQAGHLVFHGGVQDGPGELHDLRDLVVEYELLGQDTGDSSVAQGVVDGSMFEQLLETAPREPEQQNPELVVLVSQGTTVVNLSPHTRGQLCRSSFPASPPSRNIINLRIISQFVNLIRRMKFLRNFPEFITIDLSRRANIF